MFTWAVLCIGAFLSSCLSENSAGARQTASYNDTDLLNKALERGVQPVGVEWCGYKEKKILGKWTAERFNELKPVNISAQMPWSGNNSQVLSLKGVEFSKFIDVLLGGLTLEEKSEVDLLVFEGQGSKMVEVPRSFFSKYSIYIVLNNRISADDESSFSTVVPYNLKQTFNNQQLPYYSFFIRNLKKIELSSYKNRHAKYLLKSRKDPIAILGERIFLQSFSFCQGLRSPSSVKYVYSDFYTALNCNLNKYGYDQLSEKQEKERALKQYWAAYLMENPEVEPL